MPPTLHKFFIHGPEILELALLPIGQLSEEAQEAINKNFKRYREQFSRKISRIKQNEDVLNRLFISSDPIISSLSKIPKKKNTSRIPKVAIDLLKPSNNADDTDTDTNSDTITDT